MTKIIVIILFVFISNVNARVNAGQICVEQFKHNSSIRYIYTPTGTGDWLRWRLSTYKTLNDSGDDTYFCINGATRGYVYAGSRLATTESSSNNLFTSADTYCKYNYVSTNDYLAHRTFNLVEGSTYARVWYRTASTVRDSMHVAFLNGSGQEISGSTTDVQTRDSGGQFINVTGWLAVPTTPVPAVSLKISKKTNDSVPGSGTYITLIGVDWINTNSIVSPDTAGSLMFDGTGGNSNVVIWNDVLGNKYPGASSQELAMEWAANNGTYNGNKSIGGISHRGIDTATVTWNTQTGVGASAEVQPAAWSPSPGDKLACDYLVMQIPADTPATAYLHTSCKAPITLNDTTNIITCGSFPTSFPLVANDRVQLYKRTSGELPAELAAATPYYIRDISGSTFKLAAAPDGDAIDFTNGTALLSIGAPCATVTAKLVFDHTGCIIEHTVTATADMDIFTLYTMQCRMPGDISEVYFEGDSQIWPVTTSGKVSPVKCSRVWAWGGANNLVYEASNLSPDDQHNYFIANGLPQIAYGGGPTMKIYSSKYIDITTKQDDLDTGESVSTKFKLSIKDKTIALPSIADYVENRCTLQYDLNSDCVVDLKDFVILASEWLKCGNPRDPKCL